MYQTTYVYNSYTEQPSAHVCIGKNRLKQYGSNVYLKNNQEFEIELFNSKTIPILAKIKLNGSYISTKGIYLKPGERVYLNRFIDKAQKFIFSTYEVDGDNGSVLKAIANNGDVSVEFYDELVNTTSSQPLMYNNINDNGVIFGVLDSLSDGILHRYHTYTQSTSFISSTNTSFTAPTSSANINKPRNIETGRVEAGSTSDQKFENVNGNFSGWYTTCVSWKILPESQEPVTVAKVTTNYCVTCGTKIQKPNYKFCPNCGEKL